MKKSEKMTTSEFIKQVKEQLGKITPWPWNAHREHSTSSISYVDNGNGDEIAVVYDSGYKSRHREDAKFTASAPTNISKLIQMLEVVMDGLHRISQNHFNTHGIAINTISEIERIAEGEK